VTVTGDIPGLEQALHDILGHYRAGPDGLGLFGVGGCQVSLPIDNWLQYAWLEHELTASQAAAETDPVVMFTVPTNERAYLDYIHGERESGDNTYINLSLTVPDGYQSGGESGLANLVVLAAAATRIYWPDDAGTQGVNNVIPGPGLLLEPGTTVELTPSGAGAGATVFRYRVGLRRQKIYRALAPVTS